MPESALIEQLKFFCLIFCWSLSLSFIEVLQRSLRRIATKYESIGSIANMVDHSFQQNFSSTSHKASSLASTSINLSTALRVAP